MFCYKCRFNSFGHFNALNCNYLFNHITNLKFKILSFFFKLFILIFFLILRWRSRFVSWYYSLPFQLVESLFFSMNSNIKVMLHQTCWFQHNYLLKFKFNMWVYIFNLTFFSLGILLQIVGAFLCFTNLHFTRNYRCYLRGFVAYRSLFCPQMFLFWLKNFSMCYKLLFTIRNLVIYN